MMSYEQLWVISEILELTERLDKISIELDRVSRTMKVTYEHMDEGWFKEIELLSAQPKGEKCEGSTGSEEP